ncbi:dihydrofolate reductase [Paraburkholderia megapolitana]|nr:dihydrofolate reductase [Paraburkholderia megapolitana]QDQ81630.1 dihydrofolate reductase [Paraburkholderia megapolitana]
MLNGKRVSMVAAMGRNRVIGMGNDIPWKIPGEQRHFRQLTEGQLVVMGRRTYESIGRPLPDRDLLVVGSVPVIAPRTMTCTSMEQVTNAIARDARDEVFIAGGEQIYRLFLPYADTVYLTEVDLAPAGDARFPELPASFVCVDEEIVEGPVNYVRRTLTNGFSRGT